MRTARSARSTTRAPIAPILSSRVRAESNGSSARTTPGPTTLTGGWSTRGARRRWPTSSAMPSASPRCGPSGSSTSRSSISTRRRRLWRRRRRGSPTTFAPTCRCTTRWSPAGSGASCRRRRAPTGRWWSTTSSSATTVGPRIRRSRRPSADPRKLSRDAAKGRSLSASGPRAHQPSGFVIPLSGRVSGNCAALSIGPRM